MLNLVRTKLLMVEPEAVLADLASFRLELLGYDITVVDSGAAAEDRLRHERFSLLVVDTKIGEGDGLDWLTKARMEFPADELPALVFSLDPSLETVRRAYLAGANDYLITPFDPTVLESKVQQLLTRSPAGSRA